MRANLVEQAEQWRWSSLCPSRRESNSEILAAGPLPRPANWIEMVNEPQTEAELRALRDCVQRERHLATNIGPWQPLVGFGLSRHYDRAAVPRNRTDGP
jgi:hypothetical protein